MNKFKIYLLLVPIVCIAFSSIVNAKDIRIALRAHQGVSAALTQWQPTADHLSSKIPGYRFIMVPFTNISEMNQAVSSGDFQFNLTNPSSAIEYINRYNSKPLATLVNKRQGKGYSQFGSVIFTLSDQSDIHSLRDLKGKTFIAVDEQAFGGWRVAWLELLKNNINPFVDFKSLKFGVGNQENVVYSVLNGKADAGAVRTDMLERMAFKGKINLTDFKVIGEKKKKGFPFLLSTDLYPEWLFSSVGKTDKTLQEAVSKELLLISKIDDAAINGEYIKWITPLDYSPVNDLLKKLKVGPYNIAKMGVYESLVSQYGLAIAITIIVFILIILSFIYVLRLNRKILAAKSSLKDEMAMRSNLERQLMHSQRIESLGQLTGGIAHDFNNMLASIIGYTELAMYTESVKNDDKLSSYLKQVLKASNKSSDLIKQMLAFSRTGNPIDERKDIFISNLVSDIYQLLKPMVPSSINLVTKPFDESLFVNTNQGMMTQVIVNLYLNAKDAIPNNSGQITLSIDMEHFNTLDKHCSSCHQDIRGSFIVISIEDDGSGINANTITHLFDPFFSTKEVGKGTGMGLSMVHGIVHKLNGHILVESEIGKGTTFKILLPETEKTEVLESVDVPSINKIDTSKNINRHILVVDDESSLTIYLTELLKQQGFNVTTFNHSEKALEYFIDNHDEIDLVITDQTMPFLSGVELSKKMIEYDNDVSIILCSGFSEEIANDVSLISNIKVTMDKPIQSDKLFNHIYSILK